MTYYGLESCILNSRLYTSENSICGENDCPADSFNGGETSCSSSKDAFGSFFSNRIMKRNHEETDEWSVLESSEHILVPLHQMHRWMQSSLIWELLLPLIFDCLDFFPFFSVF